jgi:hypothetical protein
MSNALAIAAVTATLRNLLQNVDQGTGLGGATVTTRPPDEARDNTNPNQINLFLYQVLPNAAWRNMDIPQRVRSGETSTPPLALNLYYMLTAYGENNDDVLGHRLLGPAMRILYDHPLLGSEEIAAALGSLNSELQNQVERVRITLQPLSVEEIFRLWSGFQTQYRVSVAYEVAVVLIESTLPTKTPLPVLTRGSSDDKGVTSQPSLVPPFPTIEDVVLPHPPSVLLPNSLITNDPTRSDLTLKGHDLLPGSGSTMQVRFMNPRWARPVDLDPKAGTTPTAAEITVTLSDDPLNWPAGFYTLSVIFKDANGMVVRSSNEVPFSLAPQILSTPAISAVRTGNTLTIKLKCTPAIQRTVQQIVQGIEQSVPQEQRVSLLISDREVPFVFPTPPPPQPIQDLTFEIKDLDVRPLPAGDYLVRLRVDGVDSLLVDRTVKPPRFDPTQKVTIP